LARRSAARGAKPIDDPRLERRLGADDRQIDRALPRQALEPLDVEHVDRHALPELGDAGIPGAAISSRSGSSRVSFHASACSRPPPPMRRTRMAAI
jgi:hypothetical protein